MMRNQYVHVLYMTHNQYVHVLYMHLSHIQTQLYASSGTKIDIWWAKPNKDKISKRISISSIWTFTEGVHFLLRIALLQKEVILNQTDEIHCLFVYQAIVFYFYLLQALRVVSFIIIIIIVTIERQ